MQACLSETKDIEIQPGFEPGPSELWSDALTNWVTGALAVEQRIDGIHLGEDKYEQGVAQPVLFHWLDQWIPQWYRLGTQGLNMAVCWLFTRLILLAGLMMAAIQPPPSDQPVNIMMKTSHDSSVFGTTLEFFYHKYSFSKRKTAATISACLVQEEQLVLYDHLPISVSE